MKKVILSLAIVAIAFSANAQKEADKTLKFSVGVEAGLPMGDFKTFSSIGFGASLMGEYAVAEKVGITLSAGYLTFTGKTVDGFKYGSTSIIPVLAGAKFFFAEKVYGHAQLGMSFFNNGGGSAFTYAPAIGFIPAENIDVQVKYQAASKTGSTLSFIGLRAAYTF
jgi:hypothetical protein